MESTTGHTSLEPSSAAHALSQALLPGKSSSAIITAAAETLPAVFSLDACSFFIYENGVLRLRALTGIPEGGAPDITVEIDHGPIGETAAHGKPMAVSHDGPCELLPGPGGAPSFRSCLCIPMFDDNKLFGVMSLHSIQPRIFSPSDITFASFAAAQTVTAVRNTYFHEEIFRNIGDMAILHRIGQIVNSLMEEQNLLDLVAQTCAEHLNTRGCILRLVIPGTDLLEVRSVYGIKIGDITRKVVRVGESIAGRAAAGLNPLFINGIADSDEAAITPGINMSAVVCAPIVFRGRLLGTLSLFDRMELVSGQIQQFDESDAGLVMSVASQVAMSIENSRLFAESRSLSEEKERRIKGLSLLMEIANIMRSTLDLEEILYIILTSVTMGEGLGFNRACLFLIDETSQRLNGKMAVGPLSAEEARASWQAVDPHGKSLQQIIREYGLYNMKTGFEIDRLIRQTSIPLRHDQGIIASTAIDKLPYSVCDYSPPPGSEEEVIGSLGFTHFATVPLTVKDNVIGVIIVDNFVTREVITVEAMNFLLLFASQAASAIEMARVYSSLEETNKRLIDMQDMLVRTKTLATLGEFSAGVAHELRNPLVSIGGFARRLAKMFEGESKEARYAHIIATEVENLESILAQILNFVGGGGATRKRVDIVLILEQVYTLFTEQMEKHGISLVTEYDDTVRALYVDEVQMRQLFINLIKNAIEAMHEKGGTLRISSTRMSDTGGAGFEIADTGCGISSEDIEKVFDPFFTKKTAGTGLGLSMCSRIVETNHGGRIFIDSKKGQGTSVLVWLPDSAIMTDDDEDDEQTKP